MVYIDDRLLMADMFDKAKEDLMLFRRVFLPVEDEVETPEFQAQWGNILLHGKNHYAIEGFRNSGKTGVVLRAYPLHCLVYPSSLNSRATPAQPWLKQMPWY